MTRTLEYLKSRELTATPFYCRIDWRSPREAVVNQKAEVDGERRTETERGTNPFDKFNIRKEPGKCKQDTSVERVNKDCCLI